MRKSRHEGRQDITPHLKDSYFCNGDLCLSTVLCPQSLLYERLACQTPQLQPNYPQVWVHLETTLSLLCKDSHQQQLHLGKLQAVVTDLTHVTLHLFSLCISSLLGIGNRSVLSVNIMLKIHQPDFKSHTACFSKVSLDCLTSSVTVIAKLRYCQRGLIDHSGYLQKEWPQDTTYLSENRWMPYIILEQWKLNSSVLIYSHYALTSLLLMWTSW